MTPGFPGPEVGGRVLCVDFDGTISQYDVLATFIERHARDGWQELEEQWRRGEIPSVDCMHRQLALVDVGLEGTLAFFDQVPVDPDFVPFVEEARIKGFTVTVLSDGLDVYVQRILGRLDLPALEVVCNRATWTGDRWQIEAPYPPEHRDEAGNAKAHHIRVLRGDDRHVTMIGDGLSDRGAAREADLVFAKAELREYCREHAIEHRAFEDFSQLRAWLSR